MGFEDRDYYRDSPRQTSVGSLSAWSVTTWIIVLNVAVFVIDKFLPQLVLIENGTPIFKGPFLEMWGHFSANTAIYHWQVWRFITFQFLHADIGHIFFNMLSLYYFGSMIEEYLGRARYLAFYLICGMAGAAMYLLLWRIGMLKSGEFTPLVGASAGIFGVLIGAAQVAPNATVMLMFPPIPMKLKVFALAMIGIGAFMILTGGRNAGGEAAHLGGAALGALLIRFPQALNLFRNPFGGASRYIDQRRRDARWRSAGDRSFRMDEWKQ